MSAEKKKASTTTSDEALTHEELRHAVGRFLVERPLYTATTFRLRAKIQATATVLPDRFRAECAKCGEDTNWSQLKAENFAEALALTFGCVQCAQANKRSYWFELRWDDVEERTQGATLTNSGISGSKKEYASGLTLRKIGQSEPYSRRIKPALRAVLTEEDLELYKRALMNLSTGYGLGAVAYFRRVIENEVVRLLDEVEAIAVDEGTQGAIDAVQAAKVARNADERLRLIAEQTPVVLRPGGLNPLKALYENFSVALHGKGEAECTDIAERMRASFEYVFFTIAQHREARTELARTLTKAT